MDRSSRIGAVLVLVVVLAGCNGLVLGGEETPASTVTPMPVPTDEPTPTPRPELAPGLTRNGVVEPFALAEAHASVLADTSYTLVENHSVRFRRGMVYSGGTVEARLGTNHTRYAVVRTGSQTSVPFPVIEERFWSNGNRTLVARTSTDNTTYAIARADGGPLPVRRALSDDPTNSDRIPTLFGAMETRVVGLTVRNGTRLYRVRGSNLTNEFALDTEWESPGNVKLVALVDRRGLVREYRLHYTASFDGDPVRVSRRVRYTNVGSTTVERPSWYGAAVRNVTAATTNGTDAPPATAATTTAASTTTVVSPATAATDAATSPANASPTTATASPITATASTNTDPTAT